MQNISFFLNMMISKKVANFSQKQLIPYTSILVIMPLLSVIIIVRIRWITQ